MSRVIALLWRINDYLPVETRITYYKTFIQPHMDYCNIIWGQANQTAQLHKLQKMALRIIHDKPNLTPCNPLFQEGGPLPIQERVKIRICSTVYKTIQGQTPTYISHMFHKSNSEYRTKGIVGKDLKVPNRNLCATRKALPYSGAILYNYLPSHIRKCSTFKTFKTMAYKYFMR